MLKIAIILQHFPFQNVNLKDREQVLVPPVVWSPNLKYGFVGCMRDLVINGRATDIVDYAKNQDSGRNHSLASFFLIK